MKKILNNSFNKKGFALIATVAILALVVMISLAMVSLSATVSRSSSNADALEEAKANARLALTMAIAELQRTSGPDTRITASAKILVDDTGQPANPDRTSFTDANVGHFTGVWRSWEGIDHESSNVNSLGLPKPAITGPMYPKKFVRYDASDPESGRFLRWLVSHAGTGDLFNPLRPPSFLSSQDTIPLIAEGSVGNDVNDQIHVIPTDIGNGGTLAWNISGENSKALLREKAEETSLLGASYEASVFGGARQSAYMGSNTPEELEKFQTLESFDVGTFAGIPTSSTFSNEHYHEVTGFCPGLLTNVATGGWRYDMSLFAEQWNQIQSSPLANGFSSFGLSLGNKYATSRVPDQPEQLTSTTQGEAFFPWSEPLADGISSTSWQFIMEWILRYKNNDTFTGITSTFPRKGNGIIRDKQSLTPVLLRQDFIYSFSAEDAGGSSSALQLVMNPYVVLWNPYTVPVEMTDNVKIGVTGRISPLSIDFDVEDTAGNTVEFRNIATKAFKRVKADGSLGNFQDGNLTFRILNSLGNPIWAPGEARIFTPREGDDSVNLAPGVRVHPSHIYKVEEAGSNGQTFPNTSKIANLVVSADEEINVTGTTRKGPGIDLQISDSTVADPADSQNWYSTLQIEVHGRNSPIYFDPDVNFNGIASVDLTLGALATTPIKFVSSSFAVRVAEDYTPGFANPTTKGYTSTDPSSLQTRSYFANPNANALANYTNFTIRNRFEDVPFDYVFVSLVDDQAHQIIPRGLTNSPETYFGPSYSETNGLTRFPVKDILKRPITSLGDLQGLPVNAASAYPPRVAEPIGNSHALSIIRPDTVLYSQYSSPTTDLELPRIAAYRLDHSYCLNHFLFDDWFVSSIADELAPNDLKTIVDPAESVLEDFLTGDKSLVNHYYKPDTVLNATEVTGIFNDEYMWQKIASMIKVDGMFNINSVSVDAWKAVLSNSRGNPVVKFTSDPTDSSLDFNIDNSTPANEAVFSRTTIVPDLSGESGLTQYLEPSKLTEPQIDALAEAIVIQIKQRGPFLSLSEFVNRQIRSKTPGNTLTDLTTLSDEEKLARAGSIEAALLNLSEVDDPILNPNHDLAFGPIAEETVLAIESPSINPASVIPGEFATGPPSLPDIFYLVPEFPEAAKGSTSYGYPGWLRQGDVLRSIAPVLTARDDTFKIRAYGSAKTADGSLIEVWCEAIVTRSADFVDPSLDSKANELTYSSTDPTINEILGRRYNIISFRWLNKNEV